MALHITWKELLSPTRRLFLMPLKIPNAPSTSTRPTNKVLRPLDRKPFVVHLESILVYDRKESKQLDHLTSPFEVFGMRKCTFMLKDGHGTNPLVPFDPGIFYKDALPPLEFRAKSHKKDRANKGRANEVVMRPQSVCLGDLLWILWRKERFPGLGRRGLKSRSEGPCGVNAKVRDNVYKEGLEGRHGVSSNFHVEDLIPFLEVKELGTILFKEGGLDACRHDHHLEESSQKGVRRSQRKDVQNQA